MIEDKLTRDERIRLEALAQSVAASAMQMPKTQDIIDRANMFEVYIRSNEES